MNIRRKKRDEYSACARAQKKCHEHDRMKFVCRDFPSGRVLRSVVLKPNLWPQETHKSRRVLRVYRQVPVVRVNFLNYYCVNNFLDMRSRARARAYQSR